MKLNVKMIEAMSGIYLSRGYDSPTVTPPFHREVWELYCDETIERAAIAAPRKHSKTTAFTFDFIIAAVLFRWQEFVLLLGATEDLAKMNLRNIADELRTNKDLWEAFGLSKFIIDQQTDIIIEALDGYQFRIMARGVGQAIRGLLWHGKRPGLINGDDLEDDEMVRNRDRREEFESWIYAAVIPCLREGGVIRIHGTVMHDDAFLARILRDPSWVTRCYRAHESYKEFNQILWPERFSEARLRDIQKSYESRGRGDLYSKEFLNDPRDTTDPYLRKEQFIAMSDEDRQKWKMMGVGVDLAISKLDHANRTSFTVGGKDIENLVHVIDQRLGKMDALEIVNEFFSLYDAYNSPVYFIEGGVIWKAIEPVLNYEMQRRNKWMNLVVKNVLKDKAAKGRPFQARMKARSMRFDKDASWYPEYEDELLHFTGYSEALRDDQFDSTAVLVAGFEEYNLQPGDERSDKEENFLLEALMVRNLEGRSSVTGY